MLSLLSSFVARWTENMKDEDINAQVLFTIAQVSKAYAVLWDRAKESEDQKKPELGWRMKGAL